MSLLTQIGQVIENPSIGLASQVGQLFLPAREYFIKTQEGRDFKIDTVQEERHDSSITLSKYASENGADMTDHFVVNPVIFNLTGVISDISSNEFIDFDLTGPLKKAVDTISDYFTDADGSKAEESGSKSQLAWKGLKAIQTSGVLVAYRSNLETYENMLITQLTVRQDVDSSRKIVFDMTLEQVLRADLETTTIAGTENGNKSGNYTSSNPDKGNPSTPNKMAETVEKGIKNGTTTTKSFLKSAKDALF